MLKLDWIDVHAFLPSPKEDPVYFYRNGVVQVGFFRSWPDDHFYVMGQPGMRYWIRDDEPNEVTHWAPRELPDGPDLATPAPVEKA